jgi:hypothetical protein
MDEHRLIDPTTISIRSFSPPFSAFDWVDQNYDQNNFAIRRIFSLGRSLSAQTLLIEEIPSAGLVSEENTEISLYVPDHRMAALVRISFWKSRFKVPDAALCHESDCVGYAILKHDIAPSRNYDGWHVFEAVFTKYPHPHNCVADQTTYRLKLGGIPIVLKGVLYAQQNELNKACCQVALRSVISKITGSDVSYSKINNFARRISSGAFDPAKGLQTNQIRAVLEGFGIRYRDFDYSQHPYQERKNNPYQKYIYAGIESGSGALLGFSLKGPAIHDDQCHIIPFYGHTFNQDTWAPEADISYFRVGERLRYLSSVNWTSSFLGHDDNFGPNFCVPRLYISAKQVQYAVELLKPGIVYGGAQAEALCLQFLYSVLNQRRGRNIWLERLAFYAQPGIQRVVLRAIAVTRENYIQHLATERDWTGHLERRDITDILAKQLPSMLWVVEISIPQLFPANERKLGEIVLNGGTGILANQSNRSHFLLARLPSLLFFSRGNNDFLTIPSNLTSHVSVLRF